jgi:hypothetical protein
MRGIETLFLRITFGNGSTYGAELPNNAHTSNSVRVSVRSIAEQKFRKKGRKNVHPYSCPPTAT